MRERIDRGRILRLVGGMLGTWLVLRGLTRRARRDVLFVPLGAAILVWAGTGRVGTSLSDTESGPLAVQRSMQIGGEPTELHEAMLDVDTLDRALGETGEVSEADEDHYRWQINGPLDRTYSWESRVDAEDPDRIRWEPIEAERAPTITARFRPAGGDRGTEVALEMELDPPGGAVSQAALDRFDALPAAALGELLRRFKGIVETGEVASLEGNPSGRGRGDLA